MRRETGTTLDPSVPARSARVAVVVPCFKVADALPDEQRMVLMLVCVEEMSYRETAELLDVRIGTVMSRLARARATLVAAMEGEKIRSRASGGDR